MPAPISLPQYDDCSQPVELSRATQPHSILSAIPFFPDPDQEWALAHMDEMTPKKTKPQKVKKTRRGRAPIEDPPSELQVKIQTAITKSLKGMNAETSHWSGTRAETERSYGGLLDRPFLTSGVVRRLTARLPAGAAIEEWLEQAEASDGEDDTILNMIATYEALEHVRARGTYKIGEGLGDAAKAMLPTGILSEAALLLGSGRNCPERLFIRDALFASEDLTIEDMARSLLDAPYQVDRIQGGDRNI
jgi:hypothetical protein